MLVFILAFGFRPGNTGLSIFIIFYGQLQGIRAQV
jgi:hypothetical protein